MSTQEERLAFAAKHWLGIVRLVIGLAQGAALYFLYVAYDAKVWPADDGLIFAPLLMVALFVPLIVLQGIGTIRFKTLAIWSVSAAVILAGLAYYDIWHGAPQTPPQLTPSFGFIFFSMAALFVGHALVASGDADRRFMASYPTHFDVAWKLAVQAALSLGFAGIFWLLLWLGANLFDLIHIGFFRTLIGERWFAIPATTLALAAALHVTDVRPALVRGVRTLGLVLLAWLLPLMTLIAGGFLFGLLFTGLEPLWSTRRAAAMLLIAAAVLIVLINATYQDGAAERAPARFLRYAAMVAALLLLPIVGLAIYALSLRVQQYGWTVGRVAMAASMVVAFAYALGYAVAALKPGAWLKLVELWNFATALLILAVFIAIFSPIADPARISVASQVARLQSGAVTAEKFDFQYLRWEGERFGREALAQMQNTAQGPDAAYIRDKAKAVLAAKSRYEPSAQLPQDRAKLITAHTPDGRLPQAFVGQDWTKTKSNIWLPSCLTRFTDKCDVWLDDLNGDGRKEAVVIEGYQVSGFQEEADGGWLPIGTWSLGHSCTKFRDTAHAGGFKMVPPAPALWPDIEVMGQRFRFTPVPEPPACPK